MLTASVSHCVDLCQCRAGRRHSRVLCGRSGKDWPCAAVRRAHNKAGCGMNLGDIIIGGFVAVLGLIGLVLAGGALDNEIYVFGLSLFVFAVVFDWGLILKSLRRAERAQAEARPHG
jgi:hypothetical protein